MRRRPAFALVPFLAFLLLFLAASVQAGTRPVSQAPAPEVIAEIRVHGNHSTPDAHVIKLTGVNIGDPMTPDTIAQVTQRLRASRRFDEVEVRRRFRSLTDASQISLILLVRDFPSSAIDDLGLPIPGVPGPIRRIKDAIMFMPILNFQDGYGFTYGGRASFVNLLGSQGRVSVPLTWGGTRRAAVEIEKGLGRRSRLLGGAAIQRRENPHFERNDDRQQLWVKADREVYRGVRVGAQAGWTDVGFGSRDLPGDRFDDRFTTLGADVVLDTRHDPIFPRNAVYLRTAWEGLNLRGGPTINRHVADLRGYVGLIGQSVLSVRMLSSRVDRPLPPYEQALLGGASTVRGFRPGAFAGDNLFASSAELRVPLSSPLGISRMGVSLFVDSGTVYDDGQRLRDGTFRKGVGAGLFLLAPIFQLNVDVAYGIDHKVRLHVMTGFQF